MRTRVIWGVGFLILYGLHAAFYSWHQTQMEQQAISYLPVLGSIVTMVAMLVVVIADFLRRDEVIQRMALVGGSAAALVGGLYSFFVDLIAVEAPLPTWSVSMLVFLIVYGGLEWRAKWSTD